MTTASPFPVAETVERLKRAIEEAELHLFAVVDHSEGAHRAGLAMNDMKLLLFGNPRAGTPAMVARPLFALELPSKALVWADDEGRVWVSRNDPADWQRRYGLSDELIAPLAGIGRLVETALAG
ncbi:camphor resistance protein CrcB [Nonomuraea coxensis DSM 45129]|uniref:Camphor resistance protein CrcB n=1 Tax=Nonomuraea coxensis DSM 45129 TaxID=1122611 RepID=A0ABX8TU54_9ACTN|nr:DUF302 domain-containing protein [Nonomuraea coxensis]QYC39020.1 camphor resistance protein CrcB [Nonomuraea coxensis DSM 45129]